MCYTLHDEITFRYILVGAYKIREHGSPYSPFLLLFYHIFQLEKIYSSQLFLYDLKVDEPPLFKNDSVQQLSFEDINRNGTITPVKRRDPDSFNFDGICPYCGDKAKDFISIVENKIKSNKLSSIDETINYLILHQSDEIANLETISTKTFYNYVHQGRTSIKPIDLPRMVRKKTKKNWKTYIPKRKKELPLQKDQIISMKEVNLVIGKVIWLLVPEMDKMELILLYQKEKLDFII